MALTTEWMRELARHYENLRSEHRDDPLMIVFDIDGTILDMRYPVLSALRRFDRLHGSLLFADLRLADIHEHENQLDDLLERLQIPERRREQVCAFYTESLWDEEAFREAHRPFRGVLEVIRWFQLQPNTYVGLNTGRPEHLRQQTLQTLNRIGIEWKVHFESDLLVMNRSGWHADVQKSKAEGLRELEQAGYRIFAFIDNEPENLAAVAEAGFDAGLMLLHADTIFESKRGALPSFAVSGRSYELTALIPEKALPEHVELVWHGVNEAADLREYLRSEIRWAEVNVRCDPSTHRPVLSPLPLAEEDLPRIGKVSLDELLGVISDRGRAVKLDLKEAGPLLEMTLERAAWHGFDDDQLWFNADIDTLGEKGFRELRDRRPGAVIQTPVDFLAPLLDAVPDQVRLLLETLSGWGIDRFSLSWSTPRLTRTVDVLGRWGYEVNLYAVPDLEAFLRAALMLPRSITSTFDFPHWGYRGREVARSHSEPRPVAPWMDPRMAAEDCIFD